MTKHIMTKNVIVYNRQNLRFKYIFPTLIRIRIKGMSANVDK